MRVLLVSDDAGIRTLLSGVFCEAGHEVALSACFAGAWPITRGGFDLLLFDLGEATPPQWQELARWRQVTDLPFIAIGLLGSEDHAVRALRMGADDYVARPLHVAELIARSEALLRRMRMSGWTPRVEASPPRGLTLDWRSHQARLGARRIDLTPLEFRVLEALSRRRGEPVSRDELVRQAWGGEPSAAGASLSLCIWHLRRKLENDPAHPRLIVTRWGMGYLFQEGDDAG